MQGALWSHLGTNGCAHLGVDLNLSVDVLRAPQENIFALPLALRLGLVAREVGVLEVLEHLGEKLVADGRRHETNETLLGRVLVLDEEDTVNTFALTATDEHQVLRVTHVAPNVRRLGG